MTKEKLQQLMNLLIKRERENGLRCTEDTVALNDLLMEFQAWKPLPEQRDREGRVIYSQPEVEVLVRERDEALAEIERWKDFRASQINQEARNAIDYSNRCRERDEALATLKKLRKVFREWKDGQWCPYGRIVREFAELLGESDEPQC